MRWVRVPAIGIMLQSGIPDLRPVAQEVGWRAETSMRSASVTYWIVEIIDIGSTFI